MSIDVIFVNNDAIVRDGVRVFLDIHAKDIKLVAEAGNGKDFLKIAGKTPADVHILNPYLPDMDGFQILDKLLKRDPANRAVFLSYESRLPRARSAIRRGAAAYVTMDRAEHDLSKAIRKAHAGKYFVSRDIVKAAGGRCPCKKWKREKDDGLTMEEQDILKFVGRGRSDEVIAVMLGVTEKPVSTCRKRIMEKLDIHKQTDLVRYACREGFAEL